ncbi:MAG: competence protein, partial [Rhodobacteraceae bacterium]|nr:competence protein [Paracoccaceae bacterium]
EALPLQAMGLGLRWILGVAHWVAGMDGAQRNVVSPGPWVLPILALGLLWLILWQGRARWVGVLSAMLAIWLWSEADRPAVLIADNGGLVGVLTKKGRALSKPKGSGFVAKVWLENDGDGVLQDTAAQRWPESEPKIRVFKMADGEIVHLNGKRAAAGFDDCRQGQLVISSVELKLSGPCDVYDPKRLRKTGSLAIREGQLFTARSVSGDRIWNTQSVRRRTSKR